MIDQREIYRKLTSIFREFFEDPALTLIETTALREIDGWDSARAVSVILAVEETFGFEMHSRDMDRLHRVSDFVEVIQAHRPG